MKTHSSLAIALASLVCGCAPLQQAPLVYASKISVGVDLSGTSTETPGVSLTVGYKSVDAAYVPIAVAKMCDNNAACTHERYELKEISGNSDIRGSRQSVGAEEDAKKAIADYEAAKKRVTDTDDSRKAAVAKIASLSARQAELEAKQTEFEKQTSRAPALSGEEATELNTIKLDIGLAQAQLKKTSEDLISLQASAEKLKPDAKVAEQILEKVGRHDAYSVYGRFEGTTNVGTTNVGTANASVGLGKVFSTGIAAQNLSQGLGNYYSTMGVTACYEAILNLTTDATKRQELAKNCVSPKQ